MNPNVRKPEETQQEYRERQRREKGVGGGGVTHMTSHRTVAQDKRDALKRRNRLKSKQ